MAMFEPMTVTKLIQELSLLPGSMIVTMVVRDHLTPIEEITIENADEQWSVTSLTGHVVRLS